MGSRKDYLDNLRIFELYTQSMTPLIMSLGTQTKPLIFQNVCIEFLNARIVVFNYSTLRHNSNRYIVKF